MRRYPKGRLPVVTGTVATRGLGGWGAAAAAVMRLMQLARVLLPRHHLPLAAVLQLHPLPGRLPLPAPPQLD